MHKLSTEKRASILTALVEGNSINSTARICGCSKVTVLRLLADAGTIAAAWHDEHARNLQAERVQADEIWSFVGCKDKAKKAGASGLGSVWTWIAMDSDTKLAITYTLGGREQDDANDFAMDLRSRVSNMIQLTTDGLGLYEKAVRRAFGSKGIDYAQVIKQYGNPPREAQARYSPGVCIGCEKKRVIGVAFGEDISTSHVERQNLTLRMQSRRYTRLTNAFSKKVENHWHALNLHFWHYNWARRHKTLKTTPAVAAGIANRRMLISELVENLEAAEAKVGGRVTDYLPSPGKDSK
ncbi:MAG: IS1 family transposase [Planctomycetota bacterium]